MESFNLGYFHKKKKKINTWLFVLQKSPNEVRRKTKVNFSMKNCFVFWMLSFNLIGKCINSWPITLYYLLCTVGHLRLESWNTTAFLCGVTMWSVPLITYIFTFLVLSNLHLKYHNWNHQERTQHTIIYVFHKCISLNQYVLCVLCVAINIYCSYM